MTLGARYAEARKQVVVGRGTTKTAPGIGGHADNGYAFAKGDVITIDATAEKQLERMIIILYPQEEMGRELDARTPMWKGKA